MSHAVLQYYMWNVMKNVGSFGQNSRLENLHYILKKIGATTKLQNATIATRRRRWNSVGCRELCAPSTSQPCFEERVQLPYPAVCQKSNTVNRKKAFGTRDQSETKNDKIWPTTRRRRPPFQSAHRPSNKPITLSLTRPVRQDWAPRQRDEFTFWSLGASGVTTDLPPGKPLKAGRPADTDRIAQTSWQG